MPDPGMEARRQRRIEAEAARFGMPAEMFDPRKRIPRSAPLAVHWTRVSLAFADLGDHVASRLGRRVGRLRRGCG